MLRSFAYQLGLGLLIWCIVPGSAHGQQAFTDSLAQVAQRMATRAVDAGKPRVTVAGITDPGGTMTPALLTYVEEMLLMRFTMVGNGLVVVERRGLDQVLEEQRRTASGTFDEEGAIEIGRLMAADALITGSVFRVDGRMHLIL